MARYQFAGPAVSWGRAALEGLRSVSGGRWLLWTNLPASDRRLAVLRANLGGAPVATCQVEGEEVRLRGGLERSDSALNVAVGDFALCEVVDEYLARFETAAPLVWIPTRLGVLADGWSADKVVFDPAMFLGPDRGIDPVTLLRALFVIVDEVLRPAPSPTAQALVAHAWRCLWDLRPKFMPPRPSELSAEDFLDVVVLTSLAREGLREDERAAPIDLWERLLEEGLELTAARSLAAFVRQRMEHPVAFERLERFARSGGFAGPAGFVMAVGECCSLLARWMMDEGCEESEIDADGFDATTLDCGGEVGPDAWRRMVTAGR